MPGFCASQDRRMFETWSAVYPSARYPLKSPNFASVYAFSS